MISRLAPVLLVVMATWSLAATGPTWPESAGPGAWSARKDRRDASVPDGPLSEQSIGHVTDKLMDWTVIRELIMSEVNTALEESSAARELIRSEVNKVLRETSKTANSLVQSLMTIVRNDADAMREARRSDDGHPYQPLTFPRLG
ncbi:Hypp7544 [Branchiostoma lanceolatum]|nr:Hypp7544 [Branchiostoma lanceolatum]